MKTDRNCPYCGEGPVPGPTATLFGVRARWHPKCFTATQAQGFAKQAAPKGYRYIVRLSDSHRIMGMWVNRPDACEQAWDWNRARSDGQGHVYIEDQGETA
jgi:hypothetical protein